MDHGIMRSKVLLSKNTSNNDRDRLQIHHVTDHDEHGRNQYDLLLCTLKYSLICSAKELYHTDSLQIDEDKFDKMISLQAQKQALRLLFEAYFDFMSLSADVMTLKIFENAMKRCKISFDRREVLNMCFQELSAMNEVFVTKNSFVAWLMEIIYTAHDKEHYANYNKHFNKYYKWIEHDLFELISPGRNDQNDNVAVNAMSKHKSYDMIYSIYENKKRKDPNRNQGHFKSKSTRQMVGDGWNKRRHKRPQSSRYQY